MKRLVKNNFVWVIATNIIIFIPLIVGLALWNKLPEKLPMHFNVIGDADNYSGKLFGILFGPIFCFALHWILLFLTTLDAKFDIKHSITESKIAVKIVMIIMPCLSLYIGYWVYGGI